MSAPRLNLKRLLQDVLLFCTHFSGLTLRGYQEAVARAVIESVIHNKGLTFVVIFPRQSGKNELQAQIETYLLVLFAERDAEIVKVSPTWKPQSLNAMRRLERVLKRNLVTRYQWSKESGYIYRVGSARITFLSGSPTANVVGATASLLLECDEAQDVLADKWDKEINPMAASTNATRIFWGTAWTLQTLLAREKAAALEMEKKDGIRRVFVADADIVSTEVPAYRTFVDNEIARLGRNHPFVKTQYFSEEIETLGGMFSAERLALMQGEHAALESPEPGSLYAFLIDVAGEELEDLSLRAGRQSGVAVSPPDSELSLRTASARQSEAFRSDAAIRRSESCPACPECNEGTVQGGSEAISTFTTSPISSSRDATALTIIEIDLALLQDDLIKAPRYLVRSRRLWVGESHTSLYARLKALADLWQPVRIVIDATGVGAGLASFLARLYPTRVMPFTFTRKSKSDLGWSFLSVIETGRFKDYSLSLEGEGRGEGDLKTLFHLECLHTQMKIFPGPERRLKWGVPDGTRDPSTGELVHDDLVISAALCALLDDGSWGSARSEIIHAHDPLTDLSF